MPRIDLSAVTAADVAEAMRILAPAAARNIERDALDARLWSAFRAWFGWDRLPARTRRNRPARYTRRRIACAAAYLGVNYRTIAANLNAQHPSSRIIEGLVMLPHLTWRHLSSDEATAHAEQRLALWEKPLIVPHGQARQLVAEWRAQWDAIQNGQTVRQLIHGRAA